MLNGICIHECMPSAEKMYATHLQIPQVNKLAQNICAIRKLNTMQQPGSADSAFLESDLQPLGAGDVDVGSGAECCLEEWTYQ